MEPSARWWLALPVSLATYSSLENAQPATGKPIAAVRITSRFSRSHSRTLPDWHAVAKMLGLVGCTAMCHTSSSWPSTSTRGESSTSQMSLPSVPAMNSRCSAGWQSTAAMEGGVGSSVGLSVPCSRKRCGPVASLTSFRSVTRLTPRRGVPSLRVPVTSSRRHRMTAPSLPADRISRPTADCPAGSARSRITRTPMYCCVPSLSVFLGPGPCASNLRVS
mmetsp:Transcript_25293/g.64271  ORF Transcript_25293/g.64271 Transcript_25293/m.64271 type:complete len:220 (-) Transcript_25293:659-1318(-)